jgi:phage-related minor tail protein
MADAGSTADAVAVADGGAVADRVAMASSEAIPGFKAAGSWANLAGFGSDRFERRKNIIVRFPTGNTPISSQPWAPWPLRKVCSWWAGCWAWEADPSVGGFW